MIVALIAGVLFFTPYWWAAIPLVILALANPDMI